MLYKLAFAAILGAAAVVAVLPGAPREVVFGEGPVIQPASPEAPPRSYYPPRPTFCVRTDMSPDPSCRKKGVWT